MVGQVWRSSDRLPKAEKKHGKGELLRYVFRNWQVIGGTGRLGYERVPSII